MEAFYQALSKQHYVNIPFGMEQKSLEAAIEAFFKFLDEPESVKNHIDFSIAPLHRRGDVGYKHRDASDHLYNDNKDFFHFHPALLERYKDFLESHPIVYDFMLKAKPIWELTAKLIAEVMAIFEAIFPGTHDKVFATKDPHILLRFLKYDWQSSGKYLAKPHFDAGSFTLAIAESGPGLRIGSCPENLRLVEHKAKNAIFMLASNFKKILNINNNHTLNNSNNSNSSHYKNNIDLLQEFLPGWHDVIQLDETKIGKPFARWAIVAFIDGHGVEALPRTETHRWYTENEESDNFKNYKKNCVKEKS
jgi:hypothetical protein